MKKFGKYVRLGLIWSLATLVLSGCGGGRLQDRLSATAMEAITIDMQAQSAQDIAPQQGTTAQAAEMAESAATPTAIQPAGQTPTPDAANESLDDLMDDLQTALDELEDSISDADQDTLTDAALAALGK